MTKKVTVTDGSNKEEIEKLNKEIHELEQKLEAVKDKRDELVRREISDKIIVTPVVVVEHTFPRNLWGLEVWF